MLLSLPQLLVSAMKRTGSWLTLTLKSPFARESNSSGFPLVLALKQLGNLLHDNNRQFAQKWAFCYNMYIVRN